MSQICNVNIFRPELKSGTSMVRELHVYGSVVPVAARYNTQTLSYRICTMYLALFNKAANNTSIFYLHFFNWIYQSFHATVGIRVNSSTRGSGPC